MIIVQFHSITRKYSLIFFISMDKGEYIEGHFETCISISSKSLSKISKCFRSVQFVTEDFFLINPQILCYWHSWYNTHQMESEFPLEETNLFIAVTFLYLMEEFEYIIICRFYYFGQIYFWYLEWNMVLKNVSSLFILHQFISLTFP